MMGIIYSPKWFYGKDIIIDIVSILVLSFIAYFAFRYYSINRKNRNYLALAASFSLMAVSFLFKILMNFTIYYNIFETRQMGLVTLTFHTVISTDTLFLIGFMASRLLMLFGLYVLFSIYDHQSVPTVILTSCLILVSTYFTTATYYIFHMLSLVMLVYVTYHYIDNHLLNRQRTTWLLASSFAIITASQVLFVFIGLHLHFYVLAELIQLLGYIGLLTTFIMVLRHGKEKR